PGPVRAFPTRRSSDLIGGGGPQFQFFRVQQAVPVGIDHTITDGDRDLHRGIGTWFQRTGGGISENIVPDGQADKIDHIIVSYVHSCPCRKGNQCPGTSVRTAQGGVQIHGIGSSQSAHTACRGIGGSSRGRGLVHGGHHLHTLGGGTIIGRCFYIIRSRLG